MKYCPLCDERYDEEIIRFCTKDGTPLVDDARPAFTALPSEGMAADDDDIGDQTVIRQKPVVNGAETGPIDTRPQSERIVIPTMPPVVDTQQVRPRTAQAYYPPPPPPNTGKTVALTIMGTMAVLTLGALLFWAMQRDDGTNINVNMNPPNLNTNLNTNLGFDANFNFNTNTNSNANTSISIGDIANSIGNTITNTVSTPTPRPTATPRATATPTPEDDPDDPPPPTPSVRPNSNTGALPTSTPRIGPRPPSNVNRPASNANRPPSNDDN